jgi:hypothetical protein
MKAPPGPPARHRFPELVYAYIGENKAHRDFRAALINAKVLAYLLGKNDSALIKGFLAEAAEVQAKSPDGYYAFGIAGRAESKSVQLGIHLRCNEIDLIEDKPGGFHAGAYGLVYREANRAFETFLIDLFAEIARAENRVLYSGQTLTHEEALRAATPEALQEFILEQRRSELTRLGYQKIEKTFESIGLPVLGDPPLNDEQKSVRDRLILMGAARNIMEHNSSVINSEFLSRATGTQYVAGQPFVVSSIELGDALSAVEHAADGLNRRAVDKFNLRKGGI